MRRIATWVLVGAVAALGLAASVDALRGGDELARAPASEAAAVPGLVERPEQTVSQLREVGVRGVLTYSDDDCRLHAVSLPALKPARAPSFEMCRPATSTGGIGAVDGQVVWAGLGYGAVQVVLTRGELSRAICDGLCIPADEEAGFRAVQAVSLGGERVVVLADSTYEPRERVVAGFDGVQPLFVHPRRWVGDARVIRPSPSGRYYALLGRNLAGDQGWLFTRNGHDVAIPESVPGVRAVAWSPDERWTALATSQSVYIYESDQPEGRVVRVPLEVGDLDWTELPTAAALP